MPVSGGAGGVIVGFAAGGRFEPQLLKRTALLRRRERDLHIAPGDLAGEKRAGRKNGSVRLRADDAPPEAAPGRQTGALAEGQLVTPRRQVKIVREAGKPALAAEKVQRQRAGVAGRLEPGDDLGLRVNDPVER